MREPLAACRSGDTLVVTKLDRLARSSTGARGIIEELTPVRVKLNIGGSLHDPTDAIGRLRGTQPELEPAHEARLVELRRAGKHTGGVLAELFFVARSSVYRAAQRTGEPKTKARTRRT